MSNDYAARKLDANELRSRTGSLVLDFGTEWCGHCRRARELIDAAIAEFPKVVHLRIEDGPGRRLGRIYRVKLWPTLVLLQDGQEKGRLVRPTDPQALRQALGTLSDSAL